MLLKYLLKYHKKGPDEFAITVSHTATATVSAIIRDRGINPIFCDIEKNFNTMCPISLEKNYRNMPL